MSLMAGPEDQRRRQLYNSTLKNLAAVTELTNEAIKAMQALNIRIEQAALYYTSVDHQLATKGQFGTLKTDDLLNLYLDTQAQVQRLKKVTSGLEDLERRMDSFDHQTRTALSLAWQDRMEEYL